MLDYCGLNSVSDRPEQGSNCSSAVHPADSRPLPLLSLISPLTSPPNPFASRPSRRAGFYLPKPQKAAARQKKKIGPQRTKERVSFPRQRSTPLAEERHHQSHRGRDERTKPNLLLRFARSAGTKFSTRNWGRRFEKRSPVCNPYHP